MTTTNNLIDVQEIRRAYNLLIASGQVVEVRSAKASFEVNARYRSTLGGYFDNADDLVREVSKIRTAQAVWFTLNACHPDLIHRSYNQITQQENGANTSDKHITHYRLLLIDSDPERTAGISSTDDEHEVAFAHSHKVRDELRVLGWPEPVLADSGNGSHLLYRIDLPNTPESVDLVKRVLSGLAGRYDTEQVHIDQTVFNPARICKLYGTRACKGSDTPLRPHRMSRILETPDQLMTVSRELLEAIATPAEQEKGKAPARTPHKKATGTAWTPEDLEKWMEDHAIEVRQKVKEGEGCYKYVLKRCVFNEDHARGEAAFFIDDKGVLGFNCFHPSCEDKGWTEARAAVEPDAYTKRNSGEIDLSPVHKAIAEKDAKTLLSHTDLLARLTREEYASIKMDIKTAFPKLSLRDLDSAVREKRQVSKGDDEPDIDMDDVAQAFAVRYSEQWAYDAERSTWRQWVGTHWQEPYSAESGKYEIDTLVVTLLHEFGMEVMSNSALDCVHRLARGKCTRRFVPTPDLVNFRNGTLHIISMAMMPHCKDDCMLYCLDYDYEPGDHPHITTILAETLCVIDEETGTRKPDLHAVQAYMVHLGLALIGDTSMHNFCILYGARRAGKSTLLRLGNAVCGHTISNCADFAGDSLFSTELEGKRVRYARNKQRLVCADEVSADALRAEGIVKDMTAHSGVEMRGMNKDEEKGNQWRPKLLLSTNDLPRYKDMASALKERVIFLQAPYTRPKEDRNPRYFEDCLLPELPAFAHSCIVLAKLVLARWYYPQSRHMKELANVAETNGNALKAFIEEYCVIEKEAKIPTGLLFDKFKANREDNGHSKSYSKLTMVADLKDMRIGIYPSEKTERYDGKPQRLLHGIRLLQEEEEYEGTHSSLKDDALLIPICNDRNDLVTMFSRIVTPLQSTSQAALQEPCNDVTIKKKNKLPTGALKNPPENDESLLLSPIAGYSSQNIVTSLQTPVDEPVKPSETRNDPPKTSLQESLQPSLHAQTAREFYHHFCSQDGYGLRMDNGSLVISVPEELSDTEYEVISDRVKSYGNDLLQVLQEAAR